MDVRLLPQSSAHDHTCYKNFKLPKSLIHTHVTIYRYTGIHINHAKQIRYMNPFKPSRVFFPCQLFLYSRGLALYIPSKAVNGNLRWSKDEEWFCCCLRIGVRLEVPSLKLTFSHLKMVVSNRNLLFQVVYFQGRAVSFRVEVSTFSNPGLRL